MVPILIEGPAVEPVGLAEMRAVLRLDTAIEDGLLADLIKAARVHVEDLSGRKLIAQSWRLVFQTWPRDGILYPPIAPLIAIESVAVVDGAGAYTALPLQMLRLVRDDPPRILVDSAAGAPARDHGGIRIDVVAGFGAGPGDVPAPLLEAIRRIVARWFEHRGDDAEGGLPPEIAALVQPYRRVRL